MSAVDDLLATCSEPDREALAHLRGLVHVLVPGVREVTSYNLPAFQVPQATSSKGIVAGFAAGRRFLSWYPFSGQVITTLADELAGFETTKGSVHFTARHMLPDDLVALLVTTRLAEITA